MICYRLFAGFGRPAGRCSAKDCQHRPSLTKGPWRMSWKASGFVKSLTHHKDGTRLSAREKLILFVLADSHNEDRGNCAWIGIEKASKAALTSRSRFIELLNRLEKKGTIQVQRREGKSHLYFFPDLLPVRESDPHPYENRTTPVRPPDPTRPIAIGPEPLEPLGTVIQPPAEPVPSPIELAKQRLDDYYKRKWQTDEEGKRYLFSPTDGHRVYEFEMIGPPSP